MLGVGNQTNNALWNRLYLNQPTKVGRWTKQTKQPKNKMKKLIIKLLGLDTLIQAVDFQVLSIRKENEELKEQVKELKEKMADLCEFTAGLPTQQSIIETVEKVAEMEDTPDLDDYVREDDINDRIESYLTDNDYVSASYVDDEIESKVSEKVEEAIEDAGIEEQVRDLFNDASPAPMSKEEIQNEIKESTKVVLEKMVKALAG